MTDDIVVHTPVPGIAAGRAGFRAFVATYLDAFPEQHTDLELMVAEKDFVALVHTHRVKHGGPFLGAPPTGREATIAGIEVFRIADGRVAEMWHQDDIFSLVLQLGLFAPVSPAVNA